MVLPEPVDDDARGQRMVRPRQPRAPAAPFAARSCDAAAARRGRRGASSMTAEEARLAPRGSARRWSPPAQDVRRGRGCRLIGDAGRDRQRRRGLELDARASGGAVRRAVRVLRRRATPPARPTGLEACARVRGQPLLLRRALLLRRRQRLRVLAARACRLLGLRAARGTASRCAAISSVIGLSCALCGLDRRLIGLRLLLRVPLEIMVVGRREEGLQAVVVGLRDRVELVVVAARAADRQPEDRRSRRRSSPRSTTPAG